jgi:hypothetical protein
MKEHLIINSDAHIRETEEDYTSRLPQELNRRRFSLFPSDNWDRFWDGWASRCTICTPTCMIWTRRGLMWKRPSVTARCRLTP